MALFVLSRRHAQKRCGGAREHNKHNSAPCTGARQLSPGVLLRVSYLDADITVGSQRRVVQTSRGGLSEPPAEGRGRPQHDAPPKFEQRRGGAQRAVTVDQRPVAQDAELRRQSAQKQPQDVERPRHLRIAAGNQSGSRAARWIRFAASGATPPRLRQLVRHDRLKGGSRRTGEWDGGASVTSHFTLSARVSEAAVCQLQPGMWAEA